MTTRFKTALGVGLVAITIAGTAHALMAQDAPERHGGPGAGRQMRGPGGPGAIGPEFRFLDLTDDQRAQLRKIREARQSEFKAAGEKLGAARQGMRALIQAETIDESAIRAKSAEVAAAEAEVAILTAKVRAESLQILTAEQQAKLKELRTSRQGQMKQRRGQ